MCLPMRAHLNVRLNEEQLKAMHRLGYKDGETTGWLEDDFD